MSSLGLAEKDIKWEWWIKSWPLPFAVIIRGTYTFGNQKTVSYQYSLEQDPNGYGDLEHTVKCIKEQIVKSIVLQPPTGG